MSVNISTLSASNTFISSLKTDEIASRFISAGALMASTLQGDGSQITNVAGLSTVARFTSNTSNSLGAAMSSLYGITSTGFSSISLFTSNTSNFYTPLLLNNYSTNLQSTVIGLGTSGYISTSQLLSTVFALQSNISSFIDPTELTSTVVGLGTFGYFSTIGVYSTVTGLYKFIEADIASTIVGLGSAGFVSTLGLTSTTTGILNTTIQISNYYAPTLLNNLSSGLSSIALALTSTNQSFSQQFITSSITANAFLGNGALLFGLPAISSLSLQSTVVGLGTASYVSTASLTSSFIGLGSFGYKSTLSNVPLVSSIQLQASSFTGNLADAFTLLIVDL